MDRSFPAKRKCTGLSIAVLVLALWAPGVAATSAGPQGGSDDVSSAAKVTTECGNAAYDNGVSDDADWFGGGYAGDPDLMFAVRFELADFDYEPGGVEIAAFCAANQIDFGGPWPNEVFIFPDVGGLPDESVVLGHGTISTGDGAGPSEVWLDEPVVLEGDFWLVNRGDPAHEGEDFNMEFDAGPTNGHSFVSNTGIAGLEESDVGNYALRATLQPADGACAYGLGPVAATFGHEGGEGSVTVFTRALCEWSAVSQNEWITVVSGGETSVGGGTVEYVVAENVGEARMGGILIAGEVFSIAQSAPPPPIDFTVSNTRPDIGEVVVFSVDPQLEVASWDLGGENCWEADQVIDCSPLDPGACNLLEWAYMEPGPKSVTLVLTDGRTKTVEILVADNGECCSATGPPEASFTTSTDAAVTGETVFFTAGTSKTSSKTMLAALNFDWEPVTPAAGEKVHFSISGVKGTIEAVWYFGGEPCGHYDNPFYCTPTFTDCQETSFAFATPGEKVVRVIVKQGGVTLGSVARTITVTNLGYCDDGICRYTLTPESAILPAEGGEGEFVVDTAPWCQWKAVADVSWLAFAPTCGSGSATVTFSAGVNRWTAPRSGSIEVADKSVTVLQEESEGNTKPTSWHWTISLRDTVVYSGSGVELAYAFNQPGTYSVTLRASNCLGSDSTTRQIEVISAPVNGFVIPSAVSLSGANETHWESDFRFINPCDAPLDLFLEFEPEGLDNPDGGAVTRELRLGVGETVVFADVREAIPALEGENEISGSVRVYSSGAGGCQVTAASRTFNDTPEGTLGLFVPALPVTPWKQETLDITGLIHNDDYRSNLRLVNLGEEDTMVLLTIIDGDGLLIGEGQYVLVPGNGSRQINEVAEWIGVAEDLSLFTIRVTVPETGPAVEAIASVVDNITGDSVLNLFSFINESTIRLVGVAHITGVNDSQWRTDVAMFNPTGTELSCHGDYVVGDRPGEITHLGTAHVLPRVAERHLDIAGLALGGEETRGYIVLRGVDGAVPQVAARTYNLEAGGGTSGLNLRPYGNADLLRIGEFGFIPGVSNSADPNTGFRTNLGILNTADHEWSGVRVVVTNLDGTPAAPPLSLLVSPGGLTQFDIFKKVGLEETSMTGSIKVEVLIGGAVAVYATEIDNRSQDPIFMPAQKKVFGGGTYGN